MERLEIIITTDAQGNGIGYANSLVKGINYGNIQAVRYIKNNYADGVGIVITGENSGLEILTLENMNATIEKYPRGRACSRVDGTDAEYKKDFPVRVMIPIANERIKIVVSSGGDTKIGIFHIWISE